MPGRNNVGFRRIMCGSRLLRSWLPRAAQYYCLSDESPSDGILRRQDHKDEDSISESQHPDCCDFFVGIAVAGLGSLPPDEARALSRLNITPRHGRWIDKEPANGDGARIRTAVGLRQWVGAFSADVGRADFPGNPRGQGSCEQRVTVALDEIRSLVFWGNYFMAGDDVVVRGYLVLNRWRRLSEMTT